MLLLFLSIATLFAGPLLARLARRSAAAMAGIDGYVLVAIIVLSFTELLPYAFKEAGWPVLLFAGLGLAIPTLAERSLMSADKLHRWILGLGILAVVVHAVLDGVPLGAHAHAHDQDRHDEPMAALAVAVVVHRLPMGLLVWWAVAPIAGIRGVMWLLGLVSACTLLGAFLGTTIIEVLPGQALGYFVALLTGALLHVVTHGVHPPSVNADDEDHTHHKHVMEHCVEGPAWAGTIGGLLGGATLFFLFHTHPGLSVTQGSLSAGYTFMTLAYESAPALLLAFLAAGLLKSFISPGTLGWIGSGSRITQATRGMAFGLPLPICSCGVLPLYEGLIRAGVPATAATAFLIATPELGVDAVLLSLPLLGEHLTLARVVCAALVAFGVALLISHQFKSPDTTNTELEIPGSRHTGSRIMSGLKFGLIDLVDHTMPWIILGLGIAAFLEPLLDMNQLAALPTWIQVPVFALLGIPIYVCAAGATPLVAILLHKGLSAGAAVAFLLTGPATNITTFGILSALHGRSAAIRFGVVVAVLATGLGWIVNLWDPVGGTAALAHETSHAPSLLQQVCLWSLCLIIAASAWRQGPRGILSQILSPAFHDHDDCDHDHDHHSHGHHCHDHDHHDHDHHDHDHHDHHSHDHDHSH